MTTEASGTDALRERALEVMRGVVDPEIGMDVVELGLVYGLDVEADRVRLRLTLTSPACPLGEEIVRDAEERLGALEGVAAVEVELVWDPPWTPARMSASAKEALGWPG